MRLSSPVTGTALAGLVVLLLVPLPETGRVGYALQDLAHVPVGALVVLLIRSLLRRRGGRRTEHSDVVAFLAAGGLLALLEGAQRLVGREASLRDLLLGLAGAAAALLVMRRRPADSRLSVVVAAAGIGVLAVAAFLPGREIYDAARQRRDFPVLAPFEDSLELGRWVFQDARGVIGPSPIGDDARSVLHLTLFPARYPAATMRWPPPDWRGYADLLLDAHLSDGPSLDLVLKIVDADHDGTYEDRFHRKMHLERGANRIRISLADVENGPVGRKLDLARIRGVQIFANGLDEIRFVALDDLRLGRAP